MFNTFFRKEYRLALISFLLILGLGIFIAPISETLIGFILGQNFYFSEDLPPFLHLVHVLIAFVSLVSFKSFIEKNKYDIQSAQKRIYKFLTFLFLGILTGLILLIIVSAQYMKNYGSLTDFENSYFYYITSYSTVLGFILGSQYIRIKIS